MIKKVFACVLALAIGVIAALAQSRSSEAVLIKAGKLIDVRAGRVLADQAILIEGDRIKEVGASASVAARAQTARVIDLSEATVLPGLIDCHVHLTGDPGHSGYAGLAVSVPRQALYGAKNARITLEAGFTTVRNVGAGGYSDVALRDAVDAGDVPGPRIDAAGPGVGVTGGHADSSLLAPEFRHSSESVADGVPALITKVREEVKYGASVLKIVVTGGVLSKGDSPEATQFNDEEIRAVVAEAHRLGRKVAAHAHGAAGIKQAVLAGVDSIEHGSYIDDEAIRLMKDKGVYLVPTLYLADWFMENAERVGLPDFMVAKARVVMPASRRNIAHAFKQGVKIAFGTDAAVYPHGLNAREFAVMVKLGLSPMQAIQSATLNAADLLGWSDRIGSIEAGKLADIIAVGGDPTSDVAQLERVSFVMKGGKIVLMKAP